MHGSKLPSNNIEDDCSCLEMNICQQELYPQANYYSRKKDRKKEKSCHSYRKYINEFNPSVCPREERLHDVKPFQRRDFIASSILNGTSEIKRDDSKKKKKILKPNSQIYPSKEKCNDQDCSIIYYNKIKNYERMADDHRYPFQFKETQENLNWIECDLNVNAFPVAEKRKRFGTCTDSERKFDSSYSKSKDTLTADKIPSISTCDLPDPVKEKKPEPEVLATALLMSENEDLRKTKPDDIFDKLFYASKTFGNTEIENFDEKKQGYVDTSGSTNATLRNAKEKNARKEWTTNEDILKYMIKAEETPAYRNYVRLNGSVKPSWFPGYVLVSPHIPDCIRITSDPGEPLLEAWHLCRPQHFDELSKSFLNTA